jgi:cleavage stimulation factor subunit 3
MEYHCKKDAQVAGKIFEVGMGKFGDQPDYVLEYLTHLIHLNDDSSIHRVHYVG